MRFRLCFFLSILILLSGRMVVRAQSIHEAVAKGDIALVRQLLQANPRLVNSGGDDLGNTPLHFATWNARAEVAEFLIENGANVNAKNSMGNTPLHDACHNSDIQVPKILLRHGAHINERNNNGEPPLLSAAQYGQVELVRFLLAKGAEVDANSNDGNTALTWTLWNQHLDVAQVLLDSGADINHHGGRTHDTALSGASYAGRVDVIRFLLARGADKNAKSNEGYMAIHLAAREGQGQAVLALIASGCDPNVPNDDGNTPMHIAAGFGQKTVVQLLLSIGADVHARNKAGETVRDDALHSNKPEIVALLDQFDSAAQSRAAQEVARKASGLVVQRSYAFWSDPKVQTREVYNNALRAEKIGPEWSTTSLSSRSDDHTDLQISITPNGNRRFLGEFGNQSILLALPNLPPHKEITISFDLFIIRAWNGNDLTAGPDVWSLSVVDGPTLLRTTFDNAFDVVEPKLPIQSYPGEYPEFHPCRTGADENNTLGYTAVYDKRPRNMDAVYNLRFTFPHSASSIIFNFTGSGLQELTDESWGLTNIKVAIGIMSSAPKIAPQPSTARHIVHSAPTARSYKAQPVRAVHARLKHKVTPAVKKTTKAAPRLHDLKKAPSP